MKYLVYQGSCMGNKTSKENNDAHDRNNRAMTTNSITHKCHYEILDLSLNASNDEIKKAYRSKALLHHPDKNPGKEKEANQSFAIIQRAYEVLSDPQERSWYDQHREAILKHHKKQNQNGWGFSSNSSSHSHSPTFVNIDDLMQYFNPSIYSNYTDSSKGGFYFIYRSLFEQLEQVEGEQFQTSFGSMNTPYEPSLLSFYDKWLSFSSKRDWSQFLFPEDHSEAYLKGTNHNYRRQINRELQKKREKFKREYNETIRSLAAFIRKRDPRHQAWQTRKKQDNLAQEQSRKSQQKLERKLQDEAFEEQPWAKVTIEDIYKLAREYEESLELASSTNSYSYSNSHSESDKEVEESSFFPSLTEINNKDESEDKDKDENDDFVEFYCAPCEKSFKSENQWKNHSGSRKHKSILASLGLCNDYHDDDEENGNGNKDKNGKNIINDKIQNQDFSNFKIKNNNSKKKIKSARSKMNFNNNESESKCENECESNQEMENNENNEIFNPFNSSQELQIEESVSNLQINDNQSDVDDINDSDSNLSNSSASLLVTSLIKEINVQEGKKKKLKKKAIKTNGKGGGKSKNASMNAPCCNVCKKEFSSRNKLFDHINEEGHAIANTIHKKDKK